MTNIEAVNRGIELGKAEKRVVEAARKWRKGLPSDPKMYLELREMVDQLERLELKVVDGSGK